MFLYVNHFYNFCYREMKTILDRQVGQVPPELIQGPGVLPNRGTSLYIRDIRKLGCRGGHLNGQVPTGTIPVLEFLE